MFRKKRRLKKFRLTYGKSPLSAKSRPLKRLHPAFKKLKKILILIIIIGGGALLINTVFFSNYFRVTEIRVADESLGEILTDDIAASIQNALGKNLIFTDTDDLELEILETFPEIEQVEVEKDYPKSLVVNFFEYPLAANVVNEATAIRKSYIINSIGYSVRENFENPNLPYIRIISDEPINPENQIIEPNKLTYILDTIAYFEEKFGMRIIEAQYERVPRELHLLTERNFTIWLDIQKTAQDQLKSLKKALIKLDIYTEPLQYIDLRIAGGNGNKIIYKRR